MQKRHRALLSSNHDFLVSEIPMDATLEAIRGKNILSWHDFEQLKTLRHQGRRALARYLLAVLPHRGPKAFQALLESLQEANAQHLVDLLLQQAGAMNMEDLFKTPPPGSEDDDDANGPRKTPGDTPLPPGPDPHEYAVKLMRNSRYIRKFVDPADISPVLTQNKVITPREADMVMHLNGRNKKWDLIMAALLQRGERAYQAFMAALLQKEYNTVFHAIQETSTALSGSDDGDDSDDFNKGADDHADDNVLESDEEIKQETSKSRKQNSVADDLLRDSVKENNRSSADDILLTKSRDLQTPDNELLGSPSGMMRNGSRLNETDNNDWSSYDGGNHWNDANDNSNNMDYNTNGNGNHKRGQRRISNAGILGSVQEEEEN